MQIFFWEPQNDLKILKKSAQPQIQPSEYTHTLNRLEVGYCPDAKLQNNLQGNIVEYRDPKKRS